MKTYEQMAESVLKRTDIILKEKARKRTVAARTSVAAALTAIMTAGIWLVIDNGDGGDTSTPILQNPSEDTPLPPVIDMPDISAPDTSTPAPDTSVPEIDTSTPLPPVTETSDDITPLPPIVETSNEIDESNPPSEDTSQDTSTPEINWETIILSAVYRESNETGNMEFNAPCSGYFALNLLTEISSDPNTVYAIMIADTYVKWHDADELKYGLYEALCEDNKEQIEEWRRIVNNREEGYEEILIYEYTPFMHALEKEAKEIALSIVDEPKGREMLFADLEKIGIKVFTRDVEVIYIGSDGKQHEPRLESYYLVYLTIEELDKLKNYIEGSDKYGLDLAHAPAYLKREGDVIYTYPEDYQATPD